MIDQSFFGQAAGLTIADIVARTGAKAGVSGHLDRRITGIASLDQAGPNDLTFFDNLRYADDLARTRAGACLLASRFASRAPAQVCALVIADPYRHFVAIAQALFPGSARPSSAFADGGPNAAAHIHPGAKLEDDVAVDPGASIGQGAEIGTGTRIGAGAAIGQGVRIGRHCSIGPNATISHALVGDRVIVHPGVRIGQDGFGYLPDAKGHQKVPQLGRVIIQDGVEIGANTTIDRGAVRDTVIGEGSKIDNLVQVGHNVSIGRHCIVVAQTGLSGSVTIGDFVMLGARVGVNNHVTIGDGAQIAAISIVNSDVPAGERWGGMPAKPMKVWLREIKAVERLGMRPGDDASAQTNAHP